jgi:hypothetical protein
MRETGNTNRIFVGIPLENRGDGIDLRELRLCASCSWLKIVSNGGLWY